MESAITLIGFLCTLVTSVMFTSGEIAFTYMSRASLERFVENHVRGASYLYSMLTNKRRFQLMLITGRILSIICGTLFLSAFSVLVIDRYLTMQVWHFVIVLAVAMFSFLVTESIVARLLSLSEYETIVARLSYFLMVFHIVLYPVTLTLDKILSVSIKKDIELAAKEEALAEYVKSETEYGVIPREESEMIESIFEFSDTTVREVMVPRIDMVAADKDITIDELIEVFKEEGHSRIPIFDERIDKIIGVIYAKDLLIAMADRKKEEIAITEIMREAHFVPASKNISVLLKELRKARVHIAIVVDEYGGTAGIVALEDLLEEIVGEIQDEYDEEEHEYLWLNNRNVMLDGGMDIDDINTMIHSSIPDEDFDTLSGFLYHQLGCIPEGGEVVKWENISFTVKEINGNRISKVLAKLPEPISNDTHDEA